jgi:two-component system cell cycle sensor histidine kinase/response regulator CckA
MPGAKILVVEDEAIVALDIRNRLESQGYVVSATVSNGDDALKSIENDRPELVLMDIIIKGEMDGIAMAERIIDKYDIPVIFLTANSDDKTLERAKLTGPFGYLLKPFEERELRTTIEMGLYRHKLERKIKESERWLVTTLRSIGDAVITTDTQGIINFVNPRAEEFTKWKSEDALGKSIGTVLNIINEGTGEKVACPVRRALDEDKIIALSNHVLLITRDGQRRSIEDSAAPIKSDSGDLLGAVVVFRDVTDRKKMEKRVLQHKYHLEELVKERTAELTRANKKLVKEMEVRKEAEEYLRQSEEQYRTLFETMHDGVTLVDLEERIIFANPSACRIFGYQREDLIGRNIMQLVVDREREKISNETLKRLNRESSVYEVTIVRKDGNQANLFLSVSPYSDKNGDVVGSIGVFTDITELKKAEREKTDLREKLNNAQKMEALGILAGGVAHDLNNILGPLVVYPQLILEQISPDHPQRERIKSIEVTAKKAADVIQDLLTMARRGRYEMEAMDINEALTSYLNSASYAALAESCPEIDLDLQIGADMPLMHGSATHIYKVIMNLVVNAYDAMPCGGKLCIKSECRYIDQLDDGFSQINSGKYNIITVIDTGTGIDKRDLGRIFEPFYSKKELGRSGSGLGLAIVYGVVKDHNGYIDVSSKLNKGTTFIIYLPAIDSSDKSQDMDAVVDIRGSERVLVVDDIEEQRDLAATVLSSLGYDVEMAASGSEAVAYLKSHSVDILILDMIMEPGYDGLDTFRDVIKFRPDQKAIIASGYAETDRVKQAEKLGVSRFIKKPYTMQQLGKAIRETLRERKQRSSEHALAVPVN